MLVMCFYGGYAVKQNDGIRSLTPPEVASLLHGQEISPVHLFGNFLQFDFRNVCLDAVCFNAFERNRITQDFNFISKKIRNSLYRSS